MATNLFIDSSSLIKRYVDERGSHELEDLLSSSENTFVSWITFPECLASFKRKSLEKLILEADRQTLESSLLDDWERVHVVRETERLEHILKRLLGKHPLRGADSIQLASAIYLRDSDLDVQFVVSDRRLGNIAREEKFRVHTPGIS